MEDKNISGRGYFTLKTMPERERPYERLEQFGAGVLSDAELLAIIIKSGARKETAVDVARRLLERCGGNGLSQLHELSLQELMRVKGIGKVKSIQLKALCELGMRMAGGLIQQKTRVESVAQLGEMYKFELSNLKKEIFRVVMLDTKWQIVKVSDVSMGTLDQALVHPREVFKEAIRCSCAAVVLMHNHPSGDTAPSSADIITTKRLLCAGEIIGIEVVDHIIIGNGSFSSLYQMGYLEEMKKTFYRSAG